MKPLFTKIEFRAAKSRQPLPVVCYYCNKTFYLTKHSVQNALNPKQNGQGRFCSPRCGRHYNDPPVLLPCKQCSKIFQKQPIKIQKIKSGNHFCSRSCAATYNNRHKKHGTRRSKLEKWLEQQLSIFYPNLEFHFNRKDTIKAELDIFIPSLRLAFELNGIFHYEPIYSPEKLASTQSNDKRKMQACVERGIELCVIDSSKQTYFKPKTSQKYLDIITSIISTKLKTS